MSSKWKTELLCTKINFLSMMFKFKRLIRKSMQVRSMDRLSSWKTKVMLKFKNILYHLLLLGKIKKLKVIINSLIIYICLYIRFIYKFHSHSHYLIWFYFYLNLLNLFFSSNIFNSFIFDDSFCYSLDYSKYFIDLFSGIVFVLSY